MPFMVIYSTAGDAPRYEEVHAIDEAALFVERLRNQDAIEEIRIFRTEEISFEFRPYYKVELGLPERQTPLVPTDVPDTIPPPPDAALGADGRRGLFGR